MRDTCSGDLTCLSILSPSHLNPGALLKDENRRCLSYIVKQ
jgi:hypothetical protein